MSASPLVLGDPAADEMRGLRLCLESATMTDLRAFIMDTGDGLLPVRRGIARCNSCGWVAIMSGDDDADIAEFLRLLLMEHVHDLHPRSRGIHE
jgi:hypothetical protein